MTTTPPDVAPSANFPIGKAAKELGTDRKTLRKYANLGRMKGGIDYRKCANGRKSFSGYEILRFWNHYWGNKTYRLPHR